MKFKNKYYSVYNYYMNKYFSYFCLTFFIKRALIMKKVLFFHNFFIIYKMYYEIDFFKTTKNKSIFNNYIK